jgi:hypothetical protein
VTCRRARSAALGSLRQTLTCPRTRLGSASEVSPKCRTGRLRYVHHPAFEGSVAEFRYARQGTSGRSLRAVRCSCDARRVPRPGRAIGASPGSPARFRLFGASCASRPGPVAVRSEVRDVPPGDDCESHRDHASVVRSAVHHLARISSVSSSPCLVRLPLSRRARAQPRTHSPSSRLARQPDTPLLAVRGCYESRESASSAAASSPGTGRTGSRNKETGNSPVPVTRRVGCSG